MPPLVASPYAAADVDASPETLPTVEVRGRATRETGYKPESATTGTKVAAPLRDVPQTSTWFRPRSSRTGTRRRSRTR